MAKMNPELKERILNTLIETTISAIGYVLKAVGEEMTRKPVPKEIESSDTNKIF